MIIIPPAEYINKDGPCPECGLNNAEGGSFTSEAGQAWQRLDCLDCNFTWSDVFQRMGYSYDTERAFEDQTDGLTVVVHIAGGVADGAEANFPVRLIICDHDNDLGDIPENDDPESQTEIGELRYFRDAEAILRAIARLDVKAFVQEHQQTTTAPTTEAPAE